MEPDPRIHFVVVTAIVAKLGEDGEYRYLITKRSANEKVWPGKWTVPGGKFVRTEYEKMPKTFEDGSQWYNVVDFVVRKEVREEAGIEIMKPQYVTDLVFVRPDGYPVVTLSFRAYWKSGEVKLNHEMSDFAWIKAEDAKDYDLIDGIAGEIAEAAAAVEAEQEKKIAPVSE